ncbi:MAG: immunoglobulin-like domain-containing protein [Alphaproteobacteria bacterium]
MPFEICRTMRPARVLKAVALGVAIVVAVSTTAAAQQGNAYGLGKPAAVANLPAGPFRTALEALSGPARGHALAVLQSAEFTNGDLPYLRVSRRGDVFFEDPVFEAGEGGEVLPPPAEITQTGVFTLHSKPGAPKTVYIDFDGHLVTGTTWNARTGVSEHPMKPYDTSGDATIWTASELDVVADVWRRMAEDLAPYDVDVTTQEPTVFNNNVGHILVTRKVDENGNEIYDCSCGGVAFYRGFGDSYLLPGLVFLDGVGGAHNIAEAATHELGHNLNLSHDGSASGPYYTGHGPAPVDWGPIMGVGYYSDVTQWSKGEYSGANNSEDDLQRINIYLPYRSDDHEDATLILATPLLVTGSVNVVALGRVSDPTAADMANKGIIEGRNDTDLFSLDVGLGLIDLTITPGYFEEFTSAGRLGMNLDLEVSLLDDAGYVLQTSNPDLATNAQITYSVDVAGRYYLEIRGTGRGDPLGDGYTDYASIGQYYISGTVPEDVTSTEPPVAPTTLVATLVDDVNIELSWFDPDSIPETNEAGYRVLRSENGGAYASHANLPRDSEFYSDNNLANGTYEYMLELYNGKGAVRTTATPAIDVTAPVVAVATSEFTTAGSVVSGSYLNTQDAAGSEQIREQHQGGKPSRRVSQVDHSWTIPGVVPSATVKLYLHASAPPNGDMEDFIFTYRINNGPALAIGTAIQGAAAEPWTVTLPPDTAGTVVVRVADTDQTAGNGGTDTVTVYEMHVTSAGSPGDLPPEVTITDPTDGITIAVGTELMFAATVTDEDYPLDVIWTMDDGTPLSTPAESFFATLAEGSHVVTASVMDTAEQSGSDSVSVLVLPPDVTPPVITVNGVDPASVAVGATYIDAGATATDNMDGDVTGAIVVDGVPLDTSTVGAQTITYTVSDAAGNTGTASRTVNVVDAGSVLAVTGLDPSSIARGSLSGGASVTITGTGFAAGATVTFVNGSGPTPSASQIVVGTAESLTAKITGKSGPRKLRNWDVVVILPGGVNATCAGCLTITP